MLPVTEVAPIAIEFPVQILELAIVAAIGNGLTVMETVLVLTQLFEFVSVKLYVVLTVGDTEGLLVIEVNPTGVLVHA